MYTQHHPCWDAKNRYDLPPETEFDYSVIAQFVPGGTDTRSIDQPVKVENSSPSPITALENIIEDDTSVSSNVGPSENLQNDTKPLVPEGIPKALADLMIANNVSEEDIQLAVSQRGYFPRDTKIKDYGEQFIEGCLIACWSDVFAMIMANKDLPFN